MDGVWTGRRAVLGLGVVRLILLQAAGLALAMGLAVPARAADERAVQTRYAPVYPEIAKRLRIGGTVRIEVTVDADGKVIDAKAVNGNSVLSPAAEAAVRKWKFAPGAGVAIVFVDVVFVPNN